MGSEWSEITLADSLEFVVDNRGKTVPACETGIPLIATNCVSNENLYPEHINVRYVSQETFDTWFRAHPKPGDILLTNKGSKNGAICLCPDPVGFCIAQDMVALRAKREVVDPLYLFAALRSNIVQNQIKQLNVDSVIPHFKKTDFDKLHIPLPSKKEQERIGELHFQLSYKIELNRRMNATLEGMAQALFKSWFVDFDPVIDNALAAGNPIPDELADRAEVRRQALANGTANREAAKPFPAAFQQTESMCWIPEGWGVGRITDLADLNSESWSNSKHPDCVNYVDLANTKNGRVNEVFPYDFSEAPSRARRVLRVDDTIIGTVRPGNRSFAFIHEDGLTGSTGFAVLRPKVEAARSYVYLCLTQDEVIEHFAHLADGGAYPAIRPEVVGNLEIVTFPQNLMELFDQKSYPLVAKIGQHQRATETLINLRDTLLPKLISGELRLQKPEQLAGEGAL